MSRHGWEHYDLGKEMNRSNLAQLLEIFKRESLNYINKCVEFTDFDEKLSEEGKEEVRKECVHLEEARINIALEIAERLTDVKKYQWEVIPK